MNTTFDQRVLVDVRERNVTQNCFGMANWMSHIYELATAAGLQVQWEGNELRRVPGEGIWQRAAVRALIYSVNVDA